MVTRHTVGPLDGVPTDRCVAVADGRVVIVRVGDEVVAIRNRCLHQASPLAGGVVRGSTLSCPLHFWRYRLPAAEHTGGRGRLETYQTTIEDGIVHVDVPDAPPEMSIRDQLLQHAREWTRGDDDA